MKVDQQWLRKEIRKSILRETKNYQNMDEGLASMAGGLVDAAGNLVSNISPATAKKMTGYFKEAILRKVSNRFSLKINSTLGQFLASVIQELSFKEMGEIWEGSIDCEYLTEAITGIASRMLTKKAIRGLMIWLLQHYDLTDLTNILIAYDTPENKDTFLAPTLADSYKSEQISINQANRIMNSLIGMGVSYIIEDFVRDFVVDNFAPEIANYICSSDLSDIEDDLESLDGSEDSLLDSLTDEIDVGSVVSTLTGAPTSPAP